MRNTRFTLAYGLIIFGFSAASRAGETEPKTAPRGAEKTPKTKALEAGANMLQDMGPVKKLDMYLVGFHPMKEDASHSMEAHHFCRQVNQDFAQCVLYDGNSGNANMNGIGVSTRLGARFGLGRGASPR
jgi:hypothetical protein